MESKKTALGRPDLHWTSHAARFRVAGRQERIAVGKTKSATNV